MAYYSVEEYLKIQLFDFLNLEAIKKLLDKELLLPSEIAEGILKSLIQN